MSFKQLGALDIDGSTNLVNTDYAVYTVPSGNETVVSSIVMLNRNTGSDAKVRLYHVPSGQSIESKYAILYDRTILAAGNFIAIQIGIAMAEGDKIYFRSDATDVNIIAWGDER